MSKTTTTTTDAPVIDDRATDDEPDSGIKTTGNAWLDARLGEHIKPYASTLAAHGYDAAPQEFLADRHVERPLDVLGVPDLKAASTDEARDGAPVLPYECAGMTQSWGNHDDGCGLVRPFIADGASVSHTCPECDAMRTFRLIPKPKRASKLGARERRTFDRIAGGFR